jgi:hypothetical protein
MTEEADFAQWGGELGNASIQATVDHMHEKFMAVVWHEIDAARMDVTLDDVVAAIVATCENEIGRAPFLRFLVMDAIYHSTAREGGAT